MFCTVRSYCCTASVHVPNMNVHTSMQACPEGAIRKWPGGHLKLAYASGGQGAGLLPPIHL